MPYRDFSGWVIEQIKQKDFKSLYAFIKEFYLDRDSVYEEELKQTFEKFLTKNFKSLFSNIDEQAIYEIQAFFILKRGIDDFNREFWIAENESAEMLCKIISIYSFSLNTKLFDPLIRKANLFLKEMRKDVDFWKDYKNYKIEELNVENAVEVETDLLIKLKQITPGNRLHFFDFATTSQFKKFLIGYSSSKTRSYGVNEDESLNEILSLEIFEVVSDINAVPDIASRGELKESAEKAGFEIKKSWNVDKIFEYLFKTEKGQIFLTEFIKDKKILVFKEEYKADLNNLLMHQKNIKKTIDLITMI